VIRAGSWSAWVSAGILTLLFGLNCYRAATQSFTHDEALYFQFFIDVPRDAGCYGSCVADPHFLFTLLMRLCSAWFGNSAFSLRLPSVAAGGLYFVSIYRLCRIAFRSHWLFLAGVLIMAGNPLVLDFLVAARGYGLALALFTFALLQVVIWLIGDDSSRSPAKSWSGLLVKAGFGIGLSVTANHTLAVPCLVLTGIVVLLLWRGQRRMPAAISFFGPLFAVAYVFLLVSSFLGVFHGFRVSLDENRLADDTISGSLRDLIHYSLAHNAGLGGLNSGAAMLNCCAAWSVSSWFLLPRWRPAGWDGGCIAGRVRGAPPKRHFRLARLFAQPLPSERRCS
jgi:4-amino-4-deoxy-L-arabinose transferase-like glycosyltransferase